MWRGSRRTKTPTRKQLRPTKKTFSARSNLSNSRVAHRRSKIRALKVALVVIIVVSFFGALSWVSFLDIFAVQRIVVVGNTEVRTRAIESKLLLATVSPSLAIFSRQNTLVYPSTQLENMLAFEFPKLETISIDRRPTQQQVVVSVTERDPYALWCRGSENTRECYWLDKGGFIFDTAQSTSTALVDFEGGVTTSRTSVLRTYIAPEYFSSVVEFLNELRALELEPKSVSFEGDDARVGLAPNWEMRIALDKDLRAAAFNLEAVFDEEDLYERLDELNYIDIRFNERVYYKFREVADNNA